MQFLFFLYFFSFYFSILFVWGRGLYPSSPLRSAPVEKNPEPRIKELVFPAAWKLSSTVSIEINDAVLHLKYYGSSWIYFKKWIRKLSNFKLAYIGCSQFNVFNLKKKEYSRSITYLPIIVRKNVENEQVCNHSKKKTAEQSTRKIFTSFLKEKELPHTTLAVYLLIRRTPCWKRVHKKRNYILMYYFAEDSNLSPSLPNQQLRFCPLFGMHITDKFL